MTTDRELTPVSQRELHRYRALRLVLLSRRAIQGPPRSSTSRSLSGHGYTNHRAQRNIPLSRVVLPYSPTVSGSLTGVLRLKSNLGLTLLRLYGTCCREFSTLRPSSWCRMAVLP